MSEIKTLTNGDWELRITTMGAAALAATPRGVGSIFRPAADTITTGRDAGSYWAFEYFGRLRDNVLNYGGQTYTLEHRLPHALHGYAADRDWEVRKSTSDELILGYASPNTKGEYPFPFDATTRYQLKGSGWQCSVTITSLGTKPALFGPAWHPFYTSALGGEELALTADVSQRLEYTGDVPIPESAPVQVKPGEGFNPTRVVDSPHDNSFLGWNGKSTLSWGKKFTLKVDSTVTTPKGRIPTPILHVFTGRRDKGMIAIEPTVIPANGFTLAQKGLIPAEVGGAHLNEGESVTLTVDYKTA